MGNFIDITLTISDAVSAQGNYSTPLIVDEFEYDDNSTGPLASGVYFTDDLTVSGNEIRVMSFASLTAVAEVFATTSAVYLAASAIFAQEVVPENILIGQARAADTNRATSLNAIVDENNNFYIIVDVDADNTEHEENSSWAESNKKFYIFESSDADIKGASASAMITAMANRNRTQAIFNDVSATYAAASLAGRWGPMEPGTETQKFLTLSGLTAVNDTDRGTSKLTDTNITNILAKNVNMYRTSKIGDIFDEGFAVSGRYADTTRYADKLKDDIESEIGTVLKNPANGRKVPYTDDGISQIESAIRKILNRDLLDGKLTKYTKNDGKGRTINIPYEIIMPAISSISTSDKNNRIYKTITVRVKYSSAIHKVEIDGIMTV